MVSKSVNRGWGHRVDSVGTDEFFGIQHVAILGILRACAGPKGTLNTRTLLFQIEKRATAEDFFELLVNDPGVGDGGLAEQ